MEQYTFRLPRSARNTNAANAPIRLCNARLDEHNDIGRTHDGMRGVEFQSPLQDAAIIVLRDESDSPSWVREVRGSRYVIEVSPMTASEPVVVELQDAGNNADVSVESTERITSAMLVQLAGQIALGTPIDQSRS